MKQVMEGGCACGRARYAISGPPGFTFICQCRDCQRDTGSGHAVQFAVAEKDFRITGDLATWTRRTAAGHEVAKAFCPVCGCPVFGTTTRAPDAIVVMAGSLDDPSVLRPSRIVFAEEAQPWDTIALADDRTNGALRSGRDD